MHALGLHALQFGSHMDLLAAMTRLRRCASTVRFREGVSVAVRAEMEEGAKHATKVWAVLRFPVSRSRTTGMPSPA